MDENMIKDEVVIDGVEQDIGNVKISSDVVCAIAGIAAEEIDGVHGMHSGFAAGIAEKIGGKRNPTKGVRINMNGSSVQIDLYIVIDFGAVIPEVSWRVQENVKDNIETMTGLSVEFVNIHVEGVSFEKKTVETEEEIVEIDDSEN